MNEHITSAELAQQLGCTQRHAKRLLNAGDPRVEGPDRAALMRFSRERVGGKCFREAMAISELAARLSLATNAEVFSAGPEIDSLHRLTVRLRRLASELRELALDLDPQ